MRAKCFFVEYTIAECGLAPNTIAFAKFEESCRRICVDARKRVKQQENAQSIPNAVTVTF